MKVSLVTSYHLNNKIFDISDEATNRDNCSYSFWLLKKKCKSVSVDLSTYDINKLSDSDMAFYFDLPNHEAKVETEISYLFLFESEVIKLNNWEKLNHNQYSKVFTWNDELVDNKKYFKINFTHKFPESREAHRSNQKKIASKKLCTLIAGNKKVNHPLELYSEREKTIRWFEQNTKDSFDFYGMGWDKYTSANRYIRYFLSKLTFVNKLLPPIFQSYQGAVDSKKATLSNYKFAICYENAQMIPGYITEKIFDCFFASCIPIYWGAPNITEHIPANCFVDRRDFDSHEALYDYITNMSEDDYNEIQINIENYLFSEQADPYRAETFANTIVKHVLSDVKS